MQRFFRILGGVVLAALVLVIASSSYFLASRRPRERAQVAMQSSDRVEVTSDRWEVFSPRDTNPTTGLIIYPGSFVDPKAYAEPAHAIATDGYLVFIVPMPLGLSVLGPNRVASVQEAYPDVSNWVIAGHSQGGSYATRYSVKKPDAVDGLLLWAARPIGADDLSDRVLAVLSINGSLDPRRSLESLKDIEMRLPADAEHVNIEGGTHEYFGDYVDELDADIADKAISQDEQTAIIVQATVGFLMRVSGSQ